MYEPSTVWPTPRLRDFVVAEHDNGAIIGMKPGHGNKRIAKFHIGTGAIKDAQDDTKVASTPPIERPEDPRCNQCNASRIENREYSKPRPVVIDTVINLYWTLGGLCQSYDSHI